MKRLALLVLLFSCSGKKDTPIPPQPDKEMVVSTVAGSGARGFVNGNAASAQFKTVWGIAVDKLGNITVADGDNNCLRNISASGEVTTLSGNGTPGFVNGPLAAARFYNPLVVAITTNSNGETLDVYIADVINYSIRHLTAGLVRTLAGTGTPGFTEGSPAYMRRPMGVAVNAQGIVYVADMDNHAIRAIATNGNMSTLAGNGTPGAEEGTGATARFSSPHGIAVDAQGNVYVADYSNHRIRKVTPAGVVSTLAGSNSGYQDGVGAAARFSSPRGVATDAQGNVYVADAGNHRIRKIRPDGTVTTIAGSIQGFADGAALQAKFDTPSSVAVDQHGNIYVGDSGNYRVRKISLK